MFFFFFEHYLDNGRAIRRCILDTLDMLLPFLKKDRIGLHLLFVDVLREVISEEYAVIAGVLNTVDGQIGQSILEQVNPAFSILFLH